MDFGKKQNVHEMQWSTSLINLIIVMEDFLEQLRYNNGIELNLINVTLIQTPWCPWFQSTENAYRVC